MNESTLIPLISASQPVSYLWLIPFLPLFGFLINGLTGRRLRNNQWVNGIALGSVAGSFLLSVFYFLYLLQLPESSRSLHQSLWTWFDVGAAQIAGQRLTFATVEWAYKFDVLSAAMALLVTGAGFLIHLFSTGYMEEEQKDFRYYLFMAYLNLFVFSMLNLVLGSNILMMFLGWEGVGLCSYLLIGFYFNKTYAGDAAKKAFVTNRIGDFGFMLGFFLIFMIFGSLDYDTLMGSARSLMALPSITLFGHTAAPTFWMNLIGGCLFVGAMGKSAQIPLYVWLPDAMAGPTPVSALIHAATMVTSGLYMITRLNFIFVNAPAALHLILFIGALTALLAASMGLAQYDIKKVLAYSTVSQLGFMFMGMGAGAFTAGMFHVFTHAFFKACLFLGSGSVIMACHHEQDMRNMGGLRKYMPWTFWSMLLSTFAIAGIFPFSGFFSKDEILWKVFEGWYEGGTYEGSTLYLSAWLMGMVAAFFTAFYMMRLICMTFLGNYRGGGEDPYHLTVPGDTHGHDAHHVGTHVPHEVPWNMWVPVFILALLAVGSGFLNVPHALHFLGHAYFSEWLTPILYQVGAATEGVEVVSKVEYALMIWATVIWAPGAMALAYWFYAADPSWSRAKTFVKNYPNLFEWVHARFYIDEFYEALLITPTKRLAGQLWSFDTWVVDGMVNGAARATLLFARASYWFDTYIVDGLVNFVAWLLQQFASLFKAFQSGRVQNYAFVTLLGFVLLMLFKFLG